MKKIVNLEHKHIMLQIMDSIDEYCRKNDINYFMMGGTLLGAVRHKGFIPWDDDLDIGMLREDYEKFISSYTDPNGINRLICFENDNKYHLPFAKVIDTRTELVEEVPDSIHLGVYVDVFPFDNLPGKYKEACRYASKVKKYDLLLSVKNTPIKKRRKMVKNIILVFAKLSISLFERKSIIEKIIEISKRYLESDNTEYVCQLAIMPNGNKGIVKKKWMKTL